MKKKVKCLVLVEDVDVCFVVQFQVQEDSFVRGCIIRGVDKFCVNKKKVLWKKSVKKIVVIDDSDVDVSGDLVLLKCKVGGGFQKFFIFSEFLVELCGELQVRFY